MGEKTGISWTDSTFNPWWGCTKVSGGCDHCYAETFAERFRGVAGHPYEQGFDPRLVPTSLDAPLHWRRPRRIFVNSMSDLFMPEVPDDYIAAVFGVMAATPRHTYQALTKRSSRLPEWFGWLDKATAGLKPGDWLHHPVRPNHARQIHMVMECFGRSGPISLTFQRDVSEVWPLPNVHLGVSVEDRKYGLPRIDDLRQVPAALRFLSIEPLLEDLGTIDLAGIGWVIVGGESGPGAREMSPAWVRSIRDQCLAAKVPFFFKQWGGVRKKVAGRELDGRTWDQMPARAA